MHAASLRPTGIAADAILSILRKSRFETMVPLDRTAKAIMPQLWCVIIHLGDTSSFNEINVEPTLPVALRACV